MSRWFPDLIPLEEGARIVVPIFEENRSAQQMIIEDLDPQLPIRK